MNLTGSSSGGWDSCVRRTWCNSVYYNAIPSTLRPIFKQVKNVTAATGGTGSGGDSTTTSNDYFALPAQKEVFGTTNTASATAEASLSQFKWYETESRRSKGGGAKWWVRSPYASATASAFCIVEQAYSSGSGYHANYSLGLSPFGCI